MKYRLKKDLPGINAGSVVAPGLETFWVLEKEYNLGDYPDWFEPIPERIELEKIEIIYKMATGTDNGIKIFFNSNEDVKNVLKIPTKKWNEFFNNECWTEDEFTNAFNATYPFGNLSELFEYLKSKK